MVAYHKSNGVTSYQDEWCGTGDLVIVLPNGRYYRTDSGDGQAAFNREVERYRHAGTASRCDCSYYSDDPEPEEPGNPPEELPRPRLAYVERKRPRMTREQVWAKARSPPGNTRAV